MKRNKNLKYTKIKRKRKRKKKERRRMKNDYSSASTKPIINK